MDKFEVAMQNMMKMSPQEGSKALALIMQKCTCDQCPSYTNSAKAADEGFFCGTGKSFGHITMQVNCICGNCPVKNELGMKFGFYCTHGSEKARRYDQAMAKK